MQQWKRLCDTDKAKMKGKWFWESPDTLDGLHKPNSKTSQPSLDLNPTSVLAEFGETRDSRDDRQSRQGNSVGNQRRS